MVKYEGCWPMVSVQTGRALLQLCESPFKYLKAGCKKSSPSYQFNSLNFDFKKISLRSPWDHLKTRKHEKIDQYTLIQGIF